MAGRLATVADLNHYLETDYGEADPRMLRLLDLASGKVQRYCRQTFVEVEDDNIQMAVSGNRRTIQLPERPVTLVSNVSLLGTGTANLPVGLYTWTEAGELTWVGGGWWPYAVEVTYDHGFAPDEIPTDLVEIVCGVVGRILDNPNQEVQEAIDAHAVSHGEGMHLTLADKSDLRDYRRFAYTTPIAPAVEYRGSALGVIGNA